MPERLALAPAFRGVLTAEAEAGAQLPAPPLPESNSAKASPGGELELQRQIDDLNQQSRMIDTNWPPGYIALAYLGYIFGPSGVVIGGLGMLAGVISMTQGLQFGVLLLAISGGVFAVGVAGIAAIVFAVLQGSAITEAATKRREEIVHQRQELERELKQMRNPSSARLDPPAPVVARVTLATF